MRYFINPDVLLYTLVLRINQLTKKWMNTYLILMTACGHDTPSRSLASCNSGLHNQIMELQARQLRWSPRMSYFRFRLAFFCISSSTKFGLATLRVDVIKRYAINFLNSDTVLCDQSQQDMEPSRTHKYFSGKLTGYSPNIFNSHGS
jgi:hypothetical protein